MRPVRATVTLSPENSKSIAKLGALIGWTSDELANHLLAETREDFVDWLVQYFTALLVPDRLYH